MSVQALLLEAVGALQRGAVGEAQQLADAALAQAPTLAVAHAVRARALLENANWPDALVAAERAVQLAPRSSEAQATRAAALLAAGRTADAVGVLEQALALEPHNAALCVRAGAACFEAGQLERAERHYTNALERGHAGGALGLALLAERRGNLAQASEHLARLPSSPTPSLDERWLRARLALRGANAALALELLHGVDPTRLTPAQSNMHFHALGAAHESAQHYELAFDAWRRANEERSGHFDPAALRREVDTLTTTWSAANLASLPRSIRRDARPVFVIGAPRSGTSLVEQLLATHAQVHACGELDDLPQLARGFDPHSLASVEQLGQRYLARLDALAPGATRATDKLPHNAFHLGLIAQCLPDARVVFVRRAPLDVGLSIYSCNFHAAHSYATRLEWIGAFLREYARAVEHFQRVLPLRWIEVEYEQLVAAPREQAQRLLEFLELPWDERVLDFHLNPRAVNTASYAQVRAPLNARSIGRAQRFGAALDPLRAALGERTRGA